MIPHPQRCETCKKYPCGMIKNFDPEGVQMGREHAGDGCISIVGCASHSSQQSERVICCAFCPCHTPECEDTCPNFDLTLVENERDKVLDDVCEILKHEWNNSNNLPREQKDERQIAVLHIRNQVAELRSSKQEP